MSPGDWVTLPDGRMGYYQEKLPDGTIRVLVEVTCPTVKPYKHAKPEWKSTPRGGL